MDAVFGYSVETGVGQKGAMLLGSPGRRKSRSTSRPLINVSKKPWESAALRVRRLSVEGCALSHLGRESWLVSLLASRLLITTLGRGFSYKKTIIPILVKLGYHGSNDLYFTLEKNSVIS